MMAEAETRCELDRFVGLMAYQTPVGIGKLQHCGVSQEMGPQTRTRGPRLWGVRVC
jgi:hypothetical protein